MSFLLKIGLLAISFSQLSAAGETYYMDPGCFERSPAGRDGFQDAMYEIIYHAGRFADAIYLRDPAYNDILFWTFAMDVNSPYASNVMDFYNRVASLSIESSSLENALVRIYCDDQDRFQAVDDAGQPISVQSEEELARTRFLDANNDCVVLGTDLSCKVAGAWASTVSSFRYVDYTEWEDITKVPSTQNRNRATINFCEASFQGDDDSDDPDDSDDDTSLPLPFTFREMAQKDLGAPGNEVRIMSALVALTLTHELNHVPLLGAQTFVVNGQAYALNYGGTDTHNGPNGEISGYYEVDDREQLGEKLSGDQTLAIMNPDSYAYALALFVLYGKQWRPYWDQDAAAIFWEKDESIPLQGDWPGANPLRKKRSLTKSAKFGPKSNL